MRKIVPLAVSSLLSVLQPSFAQDDIDALQLFNLSPFYVYANSDDISSIDSQSPIIVSELVRDHFDAKTTLPFTITAADYTPPSRLTRLLESPERETVRSLERFFFQKQPPFNAQENILFYSGSQRELADDLFLYLFNSILDGRLRFADDEISLHVHPSFELDRQRIDSLDVFLRRSFQILPVPIQVDAGYDTKFSRLNNEGAIYIRIRVGR